MPYNVITIGDSHELPLLEPYNPIKRQWLLRWRGLAKGEWIECIIDHQPSLEDIKSYVFKWINKQIDQEILSGHKWRGMAVWLSSENQQNYKASYDLAQQFAGQRGSLPLTYKFGTETEPIYHQFETLEELTDFYLSTVLYVKNVLATGWERKDTIDWTPYEHALKQYEKDQYG